jgi:hypothetical protein
MRRSLPRRWRDAIRRISGTFLDGFQHRDGRTLLPGRILTGSKGHLADFRRALDHSGEIFIEGVERVRLKFGKGLAEFLLDVVNRVEKGSPIDAHLAATQPPIRSQKEVIPEYAIFEFIENAPAHQAEIGNVLLTLPRIGAATLPSIAELQGNRTRALPFGDALPETVITGAKNGAKNATARRFRLLAGRADTMAQAKRTRRFRQADC